MWVKPVILVFVTYVVMSLEIWLAPRAWDIVSSAEAYARAYVAQQMWTQEQAWLYVAQSALVNLGLMILIAAVPALMGWLLSK